ncbi:MAG: VWA domain-containing protein [Actinomycetota bacterium]
MTSETLHSLEDAIEIANPQHPHCATILVVDVSGSMSGDKIRQLNEGLRFFRDDVLSDDLARKRVEVAVVSFGGDVTVPHDFGSIEAFAPASFSASGGTPMGGAIMEAVDMIRRRKADYRAQGVDYYRPWIFLITDGEPTDMKPGDPLWEDVVRAVHGGEQAKEFLFFAVGVEPADMGLLAKIAPPERPPIQLRPGKFRDMFAWLSRSQQRVSASKVGEQLMLEDPTGPQGWAQITTS